MARTPARGPTLDFLYEVARHQLDVQLDFIGAMDDKLSMLFAAGSAEIGIAAAFLAIRPDFARIEAGFLVLGAIAYGVLAVASFAGIRNRDWSVGPNLDELLRLHFDGASDDDLKAQVTRLLRDQWDRNLPTYRDKARRLNWTFWALVAETISAALAVGALGLSGRFVS